jgi:hypothetical protein
VAINGSCWLLWPQNGHNFLWLFFGFVVGMTAVSSVRNNIEVHGLTGSELGARQKRLGCRRVKAAFRPQATNL